LNLKTTMGHRTALQQLAPIAVALADIGNLPSDRFARRVQLINATL
jgi:hypothetical protein